MGRDWAIAGQQVGNLLPRLRDGTMSRRYGPILASARISGWNWPSAGDTTRCGCLTIYVHEAQRAEAVEPGVGHALDDLFFTGLF